VWIPKKEGEVLLALDRGAGGEVKWRRVCAPAQIDARGLTARAALIEQATGEQYDVQTLRRLPYETKSCSFELDVGETHPAGLLWTTIVNCERARILVFAIAPEFQDRGLGSHVWRMMQGDLQALGIRKVQLEVHVENRGAVRLYERLGMNAVGIIGGYYLTGDGILMEWDASLEE